VCVLHTRNLSTNLIRNQEIGGHLAIWEEWLASTLVVVVFLMRVVP